MSSPDPHRLTRSTPVQVGLNALLETFEVGLFIRLSLAPLGSLTLDLRFFLIR
jgi:hypothetical protein